MGVQLTNDGWAPFFSVGDLKQRCGSQPFRDPQRIPICVRADVWNTLTSSSPELASQLEPIAVYS